MLKTISNRLALTDEVSNGKVIIMRDNLFKLNNAQQTIF